MATKRVETTALDYADEARKALDEWEKETRGERWTVKVITVQALFALLWAILIELRELRRK